MAETLFTELKRRNVFRVSIAYLIIAWLIVQVSDLVLDVISAPSWVMKTLLFILVLGFIVSVIISWAYEITADGIKREVDVDRDESIANLTAKKLDTITIVAVIALMGLIVWQQFFSTGQHKIPVTTTQSTVSQSVLNVNQDVKESAKTEMASDLSKANNSIAVLPFVNRSSNEEDQYFVDGVHDDLLTKLAKIHNMKVISRTSVMEYRDTTKKIPQIAKELGVTNILEGGVQRSGDHIRINAQLIHAATDEHLWAETYDKELNVNNVFSIQSEIAIEIAKAMKATLTPEEKQQIEKPLTDNLIAWDAYIKGLSNSSSTMEAFEENRHYFKAAVELDPNFAVAHAWLAYIEMNMFWFNSSDLTLRNQAWQSIQASRAIDDNTAELFVAEAAYYYFGFRDFKKALQSANKAIAIAPNSIPAQDVKGFILRRLGRYEESIKTLDDAASLNPRTTYALQENAETLLYMLRFDYAEKYIQRIDAITPDNLDVSVIKGLLAIGKNGDLELALKELARNKDGNSSTARQYWNGLLLANKFDAAIEFARMSSQLVSSGGRYASNELMMGMSYYLKNDKENTYKYLQLSIKEIEKQLQLDSDNENYLIALCSAYAALGNADMARPNCQNAIKTNKDNYGYPSDLYAVLEAYAMLGDKNEALIIMERLLESEVRASDNELKLNPFLNNIRSDPEFDTLVQRISSGELVERK